MEVLQTVKNYIELPTGRKALAQEVKKMINDYTNQNISYEEAKEQTLFWVNNLGEFIFDNEKEKKFNPTFALNVGKKRLLIFEKLIPPYYQIHL